MATKVQKIFEKRRRISKKDALEVLKDNFQEPVGGINLAHT